MIARLICKWFGHQWRKPHKGEAEGSRYCRRCEAGRPVRARKAKAAA